MRGKLLYTCMYPDLGRVIFSVMQGVTLQGNIYTVRKAVFDHAVLGAYDLTILTSHRKILA
jgi:hypothetical protein